MITSNVLDTGNWRCFICVQQSRAESLNVSCECIRPTGCMIQSQGMTDSAESRMEGTDLRGLETMGRRGGKRRDAYMFLSFDPLVSLLNSLQVLKMQLHQSINLEREWNGGRRRESESGMQRRRKKTGRWEKHERGRTDHKEETEQDETQRENVPLPFILFTLIIHRFFLTVCCQPS